MKNIAARKRRQVPEGYLVIGIDPLSLATAQLLVAVGARVTGVLLPPANGLQTGPTSTRAAVQALDELGELARALQQAQVGAQLVAALGDAGQGVEDLGVLLARIGLAGDREGVEAEAFGE